MYTINSEKNFRLKMTDFRRNNGRESWEILTTTTMVSDMPPSYEIATGNVVPSHPRLPNPTRTEYLDSKDYEIGRLEKEIQRLNKIILNKHKLLQSNSNKLRNYRICILVLIMLIAIVTVTTVTSMTL